MNHKIQAVILPTEKVFDKNINSQIVIHNGTLKFCQSGGMLKESKPQHLYITVSQDIEPIKVGDWFLNEDNIVRQSITSDKDYWRVRQDYVKIIATTDPKLTSCKNVKIEGSSCSYNNNCKYPNCVTAQLPESFLKEFVANPDGEYEVDYEECEVDFNETLKRLKLNNENEVNITSVNNPLEKMKQ
jgi:hypothetical protein